MNKTKIKKGLLKGRLFCIAFVAILIMFSSCNREYIDIEKGWWKYGHGYHIGDRLVFDESIEIRNDSIIVNKRALAKIEVYSIQKMRIRDLKTNESGLIHHKY